VEPPRSRSLSCIYQKECTLKNLHALYPSWLCGCGSGVAVVLAVRFIT
jgi:hypothetical protein